MWAHKRIQATKRGMNRVLQMTELNICLQASFVLKTNAHNIWLSPKKDLFKQFSCLQLQPVEKEKKDHEGYS